MKDPQEIWNKVLEYHFKHCGELFYLMNAKHAIVFEMQAYSYSEGKLNNEPMWEYLPVAAWEYLHTVIPETVSIRILFA